MNTGTFEPKSDGRLDPFQVSKKMSDFSFLHDFLASRIEKRLREKPEYKDREDLVTMLADTAAGSLRSAYKIFSGALSAPNDPGLVRQMQYRHPSEFNLLLRANRLRMENRTDTEILETLKAEETV